MTPAAATAASEKYRHVPFSIDCEQGLLGSLIFEPRLFFDLAEVSSLAAEAFYDPLHARIFARIAARSQAGEQISPLTLFADLKSDAGLLEVGGHGYLAALAQAAPALPNVRDLARIISDLALRRSLIRIGEDLVNGAHTPPHELSSRALADAATTDLYDVTMGLESRHRPLLAGTVAQGLLRKIEAGGSPAVAWTGIRALDDLVGGFQGGELIVIAGRTGMGKSTMSTNLAINIASGAGGKPGLPVELYSLEMSAEQQAARCVSNILYDSEGRDTSRPLEYGRILMGHMNPEECGDAALAARHLAGLPITIHDAAGFTMNQIAGRARARAAKLKSSGVIMIDHLHKVAPSGTYRGNMTLELGDMTKQAVNIGKDLGWPVILFAQINRGVESRDVKEKRPLISDLRQSGSIEDDADLIALLYRPAYYVLKKRPEKGERDPAYGEWLSSYLEVEHVLDVLVDKNRRGRTADLKCYIDLRAAAIRDDPAYLTGPEAADRWWEER